MKLLSLLLTLFLVWTSAAAVIQDREPKAAAVAAKDSKKSTSPAKAPTTGKTPATGKTPTTGKAPAAGKPNKMQAELIMAAQKGRPKYTFPSRRPRARRSRGDPSTPSTPRAPSRGARMGSQTSTPSRRARRKTR